MTNFKVERNGVVRSDRGVKIGEVKRDILRDGRGYRIATIQGDRIRDARGMLLGQVSGSRVKNARGSTVCDIDDIPLDVQMMIEPAMAAAIMHFFIKPIFI